MKKRTAVIASFAGLLAAAGITHAATNDGNRGWCHHGQHPHQSFCHQDMEAGTAAMLTYGRFALKISNAQRPLWDDFARAVETASTTYQEACGNAQAAEAEAPDLPTRLAHLETMMEAGLAAVRHIRPAFDTLHAALSEEQRAKLSEFGPRMDSWPSHVWGRH